MLTDLTIAAQKIDPLENMVAHSTALGLILSLPGLWIVIAKKFSTGNIYRRRLQFTGRSAVYLGCALLIPGVLFLLLALLAGILGDAIRPIYGLMIRVLLYGFIAGFVVAYVLVIAHRD